MKSVIVNKEATINYGILQGVSGLVVGFDSLDDVVDIQIDEHCVVQISSEKINQ